MQIILSILSGIVVTTGVALRARHKDRTNEHSEREAERARYDAMWREMNGLLHEERNLREHHIEERIKEAARSKRDVYEIHEKNLAITASLTETLDVALKKKENDPDGGNRPR
jgi:uncharacterized protein VirK/YbjX